MDSVRLPDPRLVLDGRRLPCTARLAYGGAYQLTIWTVVPELAIELHSSYLGHPGSDTAVAHLSLQPGEDPIMVTQLHPGTLMPVREGRRVCLYDHLAELRQLLTDATGASVTVDVADAALQLVDLA